MAKKTETPKGKGRPKNIPTPENMWELFLEYKKSIKERPIKVHDFVGKDADEVERKKERPLTLEGFSNWCFEQDITTNIDQYFANTDGLYKDFLSICSRIRLIIKQDQIEGGMVGIYNPSITQRLNGLTEKVEQSNVHQVIGLAAEFVDRDITK
jgi:hypothetical protein